MVGLFCLRQIKPLYYYAIFFDTKIEKENLTEFQVALKKCIDTNTITKFQINKDWNTTNFHAVLNDSELIVTVPGSKNLGGAILNISSDEMWTRYHSIGRMLHQNRKPDPFPTNYIIKNLPGIV